MFEKPKEAFSDKEREKEDRHIEAEEGSSYESIDYFVENKFDEDHDNLFEEITEGDARNLFSDETLRDLHKIDAGKRLVLLAKASLHITTRPSDIEKYLDHFPEDAEVLDKVVDLFNRNLPDGITMCFTGLLVNRFPKKNLNKQLIEICDRRELAPDFLLDGYEHNMGNNRIQKEFGKAADGYVDASREAAELSIAGNRPFENRNPFDTPEFETLEEHEKSRMLRTCLGAKQLRLVLDEALNSTFTKELVDSDNKKSGSINTYDPAHSIIYGTIHSNSSYERSSSFFEHMMSSTAEIGGYVEEYADEKLTLAVIEAFSKREPDSENVSLLVEFWNKNRNPIFGNAVAEALTVQGPEQAAQEIMELIRSDVRNKNALASILYRLELGKMGISEEGVRYMGRLYNLGEMNDPNFFVNRLTADGDVGVFDDEEKMKGYFNLGDLSDEQEKINTEVMAITYETLFKDRGEVSEEEKVLRESFIKEFTEKYFELYNDKFYNKTGARFNNLSFEEQGWFLSFVNENGPEVQERVYDFVKKYGEEGMRSFLSMEFDRKMGFHLIERVNESEKGSNIINLYNNLVIGTRNAIKELGEEVPPEVKNKLENNLMKRAKDILASDLSDEETLKQLEQVREDNIIFTSSFITFTKEGLLKKGEDIELLRSASFESVSPSDLSPTDRRIMLKIFDQNWKNEKEEFVSKIRSSLERSFSNPRSTFLTLRHNNKVVGYARSDDNTDTDEAHIYLGSFNVDTSYQNSKIGGFIHKNLIMESLKKHNRIEADCDPYSDESKYYLRDFVATDFYLAEDVKPSFRIVFDKEKFQKTTYSHLSEEEIIQYAKSNDLKNGEIVIREIDDNDQFKELSEGMVLTRYFDSKQTGKTYGVFEKEQIILKTT